MLYITDYTILHCPANKKQRHSPHLTCLESTSHFSCRSHFTFRFNLIHAFHFENLRHSALEEAPCNLFSIFHLMCFSHFQIFPFPIPNHIFLSPALQLFSRITSPPFLISLATLFFAKSKTIFKDIRKEGVPCFKSSLTIKVANPSSHSTRYWYCETLFSIGHYCTVNPC